MNAGVGLDKLVAEKLGWTQVTETKSTYSSQVMLVGVKPGTKADPVTGYQPKVNVPKFSQEMNAAWELVNHLDISHTFSLNRRPTGWAAFFDTRKIIGGDSPRIEAETAPVAICLAFLKAKL